MDDIIVSPQWQQLTVEELRGTLLIIGATDTGKSSLARYIFQRLARNGTPTAYLDADMGQSTLWLPTTLNLALTRETGDPTFPPPGDRISFFVGSTSPRGHMLPVLVGTHRLQQEARLRGVQAVVVDTTGLIDPAQGGKALKQWMIELLAPTMVIGLQRRQELEPILWPLRRDARVRTAELAVPPHVRQRTREERIAYRRSRFAHYFGSAGSLVVNVRQMAIYNVENMAPGALLAFQDGTGMTLALGVAQEVDSRRGMVTVRTPLPGPEPVASIRFGDARWDPSQQEQRPA